MQITRRIATLLSVAIPALGAYGLDITITDGSTLSAALEDVDPATTQLSVTGTLQAEELNALRDRLPALSSLDLSRATLQPSVIPAYAFAATPLADFIAPPSLTCIGEAAFAATPLTRLEAPATLTEIGRYAFAHCHSLTTVTTAMATTTIGDHAFADCSALTEVILDRQLQHIGDDAFHGTALECVDLSRCDALTTIGARAFSGSDNLTTVILPEHTVALGDGILSFCPALTDVSPLDHTSSLPALFAADDALLDLDLAGMDSLTDIGSHALSGMTMPTTLTLPASLTRLGTHAMEAMTSLTAIDATALTSVPDVDTDVWHGLDCGSITLTVADDMADSFRSAPQWCNFKITTPSTSGIDDIGSDTPSLVITISGTTLTATTTAGTVTSLTIYLTDGRPVVTSGGHGTDSLSADLGAYSGTPLIAVATDSNRNKTTLMTILNH